MLASAIVDEHVAYDEAAVAAVAKLAYNAIVSDYIATYHHQQHFVAIEYQKPPEWHSVLIEITTFNCDYVVWQYVC